jgi:hypothetical protein
VLKFVVLYELSTPGTSWLKRVLQAALEGITLGTLTQDPLRPVTGYIAFATVASFLIGIFLLPNDRGRDRQAGQVPTSLLQNRIPAEKLNVRGG